MRKIFILAIAVCTITLLSTLTFSGEEHRLVFIVNSANTADSITANDVAEYFLKRKHDWPQGEIVRFISRKDPAVRDLFLKTIIKKTTEEVDRYWIGQKLYSGDSAPVESPSDAMSIQFVAAFKGAIGYVSSEAVITNKNVKVIKVSE